MSRPLPITLAEEREVVYSEASAARLLAMSRPSPITPAEEREVVCEAIATRASS